MATDKKKTAVTDPLEASKIATKPEAEAAAPAVEEAAAAPAAAPVEAKKEAVAAAPAGKAKKYKVMADTTISLNGQFVKLNKDDVVSEASYGPQGMARIMESNVALSEVEE